MERSAAQKVCFAVFITGLTVWRAWETRRKQGAVRGDIRMAWTFYALVISTGIVFIGTLLEFCFVPRKFSPLIAVLGGGLLVAAHVLRLNAIRSLDRYWSLHVEIRERQSLVQEGVYKYLRHPAYASFILEHIAVPLLGNAWWSLGAALFVFTPMVLVRIRVEEAALTEKFGDEYREYQRNVGALTPRLSSVTHLWKSRQSDS
jgi:protein-S-isoprenylcysteine O-methyltransferase Ste14